MDLILLHRSQTLVTAEKKIKQKYKFCLSHYKYSYGNLSLFSLITNILNVIIPLFFLIVQWVFRYTYLHCITWPNRGIHGRDCMEVGFTTTCTAAISAYNHWCCEFKSQSEWGVQHYEIKFVSDLRQVGGFLRVLRFPPPIKLTSTI